VRAPWRKLSFGPQRPFTANRVQASRHTRTLGRTIALIASCALAACAVDPDAVRFEPVSMLAPDPAPADTDIREFLNGAPELIVAGARLNVELLRRFYARHRFEPVWTTRPEQAASLVEAISRAGDQGLDPELFHASLLRDTSPSPDHELLLSDAFLSYASALAFGAVPADRRRDDEALKPEPVDVAAALDAAIDSPDPAAAIERLAPATPAYHGLREALRKYRSEGPGDLLRKIEVNLERQRWLPRPLPADRVWVDVAAEQLAIFRADQPVFSSRVVVGEDIPRNQTPEFSTIVQAALFNPPWVIPRDIVSGEILPKIASEPDYLARNNMVLLPNGEAEQLPGPTAGLGLLMFDMPNRFDVYLHDTPDREIFERSNRRISHGCIRVQNPREVAALLMQEPVAAIDEGIAQGGTTRHQLPTPVPVFVVYQTASTDTDGRLQLYPDFYKRDAEIWQKLHPGAPVAAADFSSTAPTPARHILRAAVSAPPGGPKHRPTHASAGPARSHKETSTVRPPRPSPPPRSLPRPVRR
jgi:L,D-transpeptidase YcbB